MMKNKRRSSGIVYSQALRLLFGLASIGPAMWLDVNNAEKKDDCKAHLVELGKAIEAYVKDNGGRFPTMPLYPLKKEGDRDEPPGLSKLLRKYVSSDEIFICPTAPTAIQDLGLCYIWNDELNGKLKEGFPNPSQTWMATDIASIYPALPPEVLQMNNLTPEMVPMPHVRGYNILYADGKVKWSATPPKVRITEVPRSPGALGAPGVGANPPGGKGKTGS